MSVENIILGLLREPSTGYQIKRSFDEVFNNFWAAEQSQIYRTLKALEARGLVRSRLLPPAKGPQRRAYSRTPSGRRALLDWLSGEFEVGDFRVPYLSKLFFLDQLEDWGQTQHLLTGVLDHFEKRLEILRQHDEDWKGNSENQPGEDSDEDFHAYLVLTHGIARAEAVTVWARAALDRISSRAGRSPKGDQNERRERAS